MYKLRYVFALILLFLLGCSGISQQTATLAPPTKHSPATLPPTWTLTPSVPPSETPVRPATLTFTPLPSVTPLPPTLIPSLTSNIPTPTATPTISPTQVITDCNFWAVGEGIEIHSVPFDETFRLLPTMIPTVTYQAITYHPTYYEIMLDDEPVGWVDYRSLSVRSEGAGCSNLPFDDREWMDFPDVCYFTTDEEMDVYADSELTEYFDTVSPEVPHRILLQYQNIYFLQDAMPAPGYYIDASQVNTFGNCESIPKAGITLIDSWLWSEPDGKTGEQVILLEAGSSIYIQEGPIGGTKPPNISETGSWYLVLGPGQGNGNPSGWIWSADFEFE